MSGPLEGKTALVTGASRGIGEAIAIGLARAGADIIGVSRNGPGEHVSERVVDLGRTFDGYAVDFAQRRAVEQFATSVAQERAVDIVINNAGTIRRAPAAEHPLDWWDEVIEVDLTAQFIVAQTLGRMMLERESGKIVFIASMLSFQGGITVPGYTASKAGVAGLTKALANEWAGRGVNVNAVAPGYIATDNTEQLRADATRNRQIIERIPAGRWGTPEDLVGPVVFLSSDAASYVHGAVLTVDGGWLAR